MVQVVYAKRGRDYMASVDEALLEGGTTSLVCLLKDNRNNTIEHALQVYKERRDLFLEFRTSIDRKAAAGMKLNSATSSAYALVSILEDLYTDQKVGGAITEEYLLDRRGRPLRTRVNDKQTLESYLTKTLNNSLAPAERKGIVGLRIHKHGGIDLRWLAKDAGYNIDSLVSEDVRKGRKSQQSIVSETGGFEKVRFESSFLAKTYCAEFHSSQSVTAIAGERLREHTVGKIDFKSRADATEESYARIFVKGGDYSSEITPAGALHIASQVKNVFDRLSKQQQTKNKAKELLDTYTAAYLKGVIDTQIAKDAKQAWQYSQKYLREERFELAKQWIQRAAELNTEKYGQYVCCEGRLGFVEEQAGKTLMERSTKLMQEGKYDAALAAANQAATYNPSLEKRRNITEQLAEHYAHAKGLKRVGLNASSGIYCVINFFSKRKNVA